MHYGDKRPGAHKPLMGRKVDCAVSRGCARSPELSWISDPLRNAVRGQPALRKPYGHCWTEHGAAQGGLGKPLQQPWTRVSYRCACRPTVMDAWTAEVHRLLL